MKQLSGIIGAILLLGLAPLPAQEAAAPEPAAAEVDERASHSVTVIVRHHTTNIPLKFTGYLHWASARLTMPLLSLRTSGWVAHVDAELATLRKEAGNKGPANRADFVLRITDTSKQTLRSSEERPHSYTPVEILEVTLPLQIDVEIPVYNSKEMRIAILFEKYAAASR